MGKVWQFALPLFLVAASAVAPAGPADLKADAPREAPKEVRALTGTYTGSWTMYGIDEKGKVVKRMSWTDTMKAGSPEIKGGRAFVTTADEMIFEGGRTPPLKVEGKEGYYLNKEGGLGEYFIETFDQVHRMAKLGDNVWSYAAAATEADLLRLGFPKGVKGQHVLVKVVTKEKGVETHRISRLTTVSWKDKDGQERALQFISLQGQHKRRR